MDRDFVIATVVQYEVTPEFAETNAVNIRRVMADVRALGNEAEGEPVDRVDLVFADGESK